jgi:hypothetical protein
MRSKIQKITLTIALIMILGVVVISGCINNSTNQTMNSTASAGHFENQYVKFELPAGVTAKDTSNDTSFDIILFKNGRDIGEINSVVAPPQALNAIEGSNTTFAGKKAIESNDEFGSSLYILIRTDSQGNNIGIRIELDPGYQEDYKYIKNSFIIKKTL